MLVPKVPRCSPRRSTSSGGHGTYRTSLSPLHLSPRLSRSFPESVHVRPATAPESSRTRVPLPDMGICSLPRRGEAQRRPPPPVSRTPRAPAGPGGRMHPRLTHRSVWGCYPGELPVIEGPWSVCAGAGAVPPSDSRAALAAPLGQGAGQAQVDELWRSCLAGSISRTPLFRPGCDGGSQPRDGGEPWQHRGTIPMCCANAARGWRSKPAGTRMAVPGHGDRLLHENRF